MPQSSSHGMVQWLRTNKNSLSTQQSRNVISKNKIKTNTKSQNFRISGERKIKSYLINLDDKQI